MSGRRVRRSFAPSRATTPELVHLVHQHFEQYSQPHSLNESRDKLRTSVLKSHGQSHEKRTFKSLSPCPCQGQSAHYLLEAYSNKNVLFAFRAAIGNTASYAVDCCGHRQESWQRKHATIQYCNAELADYTKAAKFSCAVSLFIYFFPACYHYYAIESFLWNILLNTIRQRAFFILTE